MSRPFRVTRSVRLPDELRVQRSLRAPELGPRIVLFSGGTALRPLARLLEQYTHKGERLERLGIQVLWLDLVTPSSTPHIHPRRLTEALLSLT